MTILDQIQKGVQELAFSIRLTEGGNLLPDRTRSFSESPSGYQMARTAFEVRLRAAILKNRFSHYVSARDSAVGASWELTGGLMHNRTGSGLGDTAQACAGYPARRVGMRRHGGRRRGLRAHPGA